MELPLVSSALLQLSELWSCLNQNASAEPDTGITTENVLLAQVDALTAPQTALATNVLFQLPAMETDHANAPMVPTSLPHLSVIATNVLITQFHAPV